jgi:hypothetical protein
MSNFKNSNSGPDPPKNSAVVSPPAKNSQQTKIKSKKKLKTFFNRITLTSIILLLIVAIIEHNFDLHQSYNIILQLVNEVGIALFIVGSVSIFMEITDYGKFLIETVTGIMAKDEFILGLSTERLEEIKKKIEHKLYLFDQPSDRASFYRSVQEVILKFIKECYYEEFSNDIQCIICGDTIFKTVTRRIIIVNPTQEAKKKIIPIGTALNRIPNVKDTELFTLKKFTVTTNQEELNLLNKVHLTIKNPDPIKSRYDIEFIGDYELSIDKKCTVELQFDSIVHISDIHYFNSVTAPCKNYSSTFFLESDNHTLAGYGFGFMDENKMRITRYTSSNAIKIEFNDWILPGDGVIFTILNSGHNNLRDEESLSKKLKNIIERPDEQTNILFPGG